ncbi:MAG: hypothetical protein PHV59_08110 [Victivallales bacterium]|nr:hypothetical protein [Victivallales bacterium]
MSVLATDIKFFLSGGAVNSDPNAALGGAKSSVEVVNDTLNNLFDDVSGDEHTAGDTEYRCIFVKNNSAETAYNVKIWIESNTTSAEDTFNIGLDLSGPSDTADTIANEGTAPDPAVTFSAAANQAAGLAIGDLTAGQSFAIWIKRIVSAGSTPQSANEATLKVYADTL